MLPYSRKKFVRHVLGFVIVGLLAACSEDKKVEATLDSLWDNKFSSCGQTCHSANAADGTENGPDLSSKATFVANLNNKTVNADYPNWIKTGDCNDTKMINAGNANSSTLVASLIRSVADVLEANANCATSYNLHDVNKVTISDAELRDALISWVNAGASK